MSRSLRDLEKSVDKLEPWLRRWEWAPITSMLIASVMKSTDELLEEIAACTDGDPVDRGALRGRLMFLRLSFKRLPHKKPLVRGEPRPSV